MGIEIKAAWISGVLNVVATMIAAITAGLIGKKFSDTKKLKQNLETARHDIEFLLAVERAHCEIHRDRDGKPLKFKVRDQVRDEKQLHWSGLHTPGRVRSDQNF